MHSDERGQGACTLGLVHGRCAGSVGAAIYTSLRLENVTIKNFLNTCCC